MNQKKVISVIVIPYSQILTIFSRNINEKLTAKNNLGSVAVKKRS